MHVLRSAVLVLATLALVAVLCVGVMLATPSRAALNSSANSASEAQALIGSCGISGQVAAYFWMEPGSSYRRYFPAMLLSPELDGVDDAFVVVYTGAVVHVNQAPVPGLPANNRLEDALCVVLSNGDHVVYANVSRSGMYLPGSAHIN